MNDVLKPDFNNSSKEILLGISDLMQANVNKNLLARVKENLPEFIRARKSFGRSNSQTTIKMMTLTMLSNGSPYRILRQCISEIESRVTALQEAAFKLEQEKITLQNESNTSKIKSIEIKKLKASIEMSEIYIEGALKDIAALQDTYDAVKKEYGIKDDWKEIDFEKAELEHHVKSIFLLGFRDRISQGTLNPGTLEYCQQFGIHPYILDKEVNSYIEILNNPNINSDNVDINHLYNWLDEVWKKHKEAPIQALKRLGLATNISDYWLR